MKQDTEAWVVLLLAFPWKRRPGWLVVVQAGSAQGVSQRHLVDSPAPAFPGGLSAGVSLGVSWAPAQRKSREGEGNSLPSWRFHSRGEDKPQVPKITWVEWMSVGEETPARRPRETRVRLYVVMAILILLFL